MRKFDNPELIGRVKTWLDGGRAPPFMFEIIPTNNCNLRCLSCLARSEHKYEPEKELSEEEFLKIVEEACEIGVKYFQIVGGGEPLMRKHLTLKIMKIIKKNDAFGFLITNGTLFNRKIIKKIIEIEWDTVFFSLDAPDSETNDYLRGVKGSFEKCTNNIKVFTELKSSMNKNKPNIVIGPVLSSFNYNKLPEFILLTNKLGVQNFTLQPLSGPNNNEIIKKFKLLKYQIEELKNYIKESQYLANKYGIETNFDEFDNSISKNSTEIRKIIRMDLDDSLSIPCFNPWFSMGVNAKGDVRFCSAIENPKLTLKNKGIKEVWYGKEFSKFRKRLQNNNIFLKCKKCCGTNIMTTRKIRQKLNELKNKYIEMNYYNY